MEAEKDYTVKDDMICPVTNSHCDDECCPVGSTCNMSYTDIVDCESPSSEPELDVFDEWAEERAEKHWVIRKLESIRGWWYNEGRYYHIYFKHGIKNIWYWLPIVWKDRHWDSHYIFEIMIHKIKAQSKYIGERDIHTRAKRDAEIMMTCVRLMKHIDDEFYSSEYSDYHKTKHWFEDVPGKEGMSSWKSRLLEENFDDFYKKYPLIHKRVLNGEGVFGREGREDDKQIIAMNIGHINHNRAVKLLFNIMGENIQKWWD